MAVDIGVDRRALWRLLEQIERHPEWMVDAVAIRFVGAQRRGVGTVFDCDTSVGPFRLTDRMTITEWRPRRAMGVRHEGLVTGEGRFRLRSRRGGRTRFTWEERLVFPWQFCGPVGASVAAIALRRMWRRSLRNLKAIAESAD